MSRVLVVGCGGIGGTLAATIGASGVATRVVGLSTNPAIAEAVRAHGYRLADRGRPVVATPGEVVATAPAEPFDIVLLATQPPQVEDAARAALPALAPDGTMVVLQNGLCEERVAAIAGPDRTVGAVVMWGASMPEPGVYARTSSGGFTLGRLDGAPTRASTPSPASSRPSAPSRWPPISAAPAGRSSRSTARSPRSAPSAATASARSSASPSRAGSRSRS